MIHRDVSKTIATSKTKNFMVLVVCDLQPSTTFFSFFFNNFLVPFSIKNTTNNKTQKFFIYKKK